MKRLTVIMIACLCALIALPSAFAAESKATGHGSQAGGREARRSRYEV